MAAIRMLVAVVAVAAGLYAMPAAAADPVEFGLGQGFTLGGGQEAIGDGLRVQFTDVLEDSRCPTEVQCFWSGQARIAVLVQPPGSPPVTTEFNTNPAPGQNRQTVEVGGYRVELTALQPHPRTPGETIPFGDYRATLVVHTA
ncbi:hypothetical protein MAGR_54210 [Mycolicibacterium agri]|nr:hypothetical protein MAGR_54210 [Mycolicibacterium agri]